ncbi:MAG TPA: FKBP-type peptidyl-prolyl cis-trans isomerase [Caldimonas sp.]|jgi:FKBP-type peptidyl-prolyl cis-trans isomerase FkpA
MNAHRFPIVLSASLALAATAWLGSAGAQPASGTAPMASPGLVYKSLREGKGASPTAADTVKVNYRGTLVDGTEFDSSYARNEPAVFPLGRVIKCWTEGVQRMKVGGKAELTCPPELAYGQRAAGKIPPGSTLRFEIELLAINPH